jgi:predicted exporter
MTAPTAQTLRDHLLPLLAAAGWEATSRTATRDDLMVSFGIGVAFIDELSGAERILRLHARVTSVEQAVAYLRIAGVLPAVADSGWRAEPPCILCGQPAARGLRHCPSCQDVLGHTAPLTEVLPGGDR